MLKGFTLGELEELYARALFAAGERGGPTAGGLPQALQRLAEALDVVHAMLYREDGPPLADPGGAVRERLAAAPAEVPTRSFRVRPKSTARVCPECGGGMWRTSSGWTCSEGHGGMENTSE